MEAIVLAGGFGTRLSTVVSDVPKPMAPINGRPFLEYLLDDLNEKGISRVILAVGYKKEIIKSYFKKKYKNIDIIYSNEDIPLGTGGAIKKALILAEDENIFIINGDTFFDVNLKEMYQFHKKNNSKLTLAIKEMEKFDRYGSLILEGDKIIKFEEKKYVDKGYINGGIYLINKELLKKEEKENFSFEKEILENEKFMIEKYGYEAEGYFIDIGIPQDYYKFEKRIKFEIERDNIKIDVSVIIVNYNTLKLTKNTIDSIFEKTEGLSYEIILVDNASTDGSVEYFEKNYKNKIIFIKNNKNLGFGRANNKGIEIAKGKYIFLLNSDTLLINNAIKILFDFMEKTKECGVCGGNLYDVDLKPAHSFLPDLPYMTLKIECNNYLNIISKVYRKLRKKRSDFNYDNFPKKVGYITGANMMIRKKLLDKVGMFDDDFFMYSEEVELTYRIYKAGYISFSVPEAKIIHLEGKSIIFKENRFKMILESKYKYYYKISNLKTCEQLYYVLQIGYLLSAILRLNKDYWKMYKLNKEEYKKFLQSYKNLRKDY